MREAGRNGHHIAQAGRNIRLTTNVLSPSNNFTVTLEPHRKTAAGRNGYHVAQTGRNNGLTEIYAVAWIIGFSRAPRDDRAVALKRQRMILARPNSHYAVQTRRNVRFTIDITSPGNDCAIASERQ